MTQNETEYDTALDEMLIDCQGWDSEIKQLKEVFDRGIDFQKKQKKEWIKCQNCGHKVNKNDT